MRRSFLLGFGLLVLILVGALSAFRYFQLQKLNDELAELNSESKALIAQRGEVFGEEYEEQLQSAKAKAVFDVLNADTIRWSNVIERINSTLPSISRTQAGLDIVSYAGSTGKEVSLSVSTLPDRENPYADVADMIRAFEDSNFFAENFVPSISSGISAEGKEILTFTFNLQLTDDLLSGASENPVSSETSAPAPESSQQILR